MREFFKGFIMGCGLGSMFICIYMISMQGCPQKAPYDTLPPIQYEPHTFEVAAYCPCEKCCGKWADGITASGIKAIGKFVAADRRFPFGTVMEIPGYGKVKVEDRGGAITGDKLDVFFPTHQAALNWGRKTLEIKVHL